jgi:nucleoside-diphosphate-sugar epimerase
VPRALVTGATGLVGSHIVERLLADGWQVRALVRSLEGSSGRAKWDGLRWLRERGVELAAGDVLDASSFARAATNSDAIFHTAAVITTGGGWEAYRRVNIDGARAAVDAASVSGARLLQLSSVAVYGPSARYQPTGGRTDESTVLAPLSDASFYARSKRESEQVVLEAHSAGRIWATAVRPDVIFGPRDRQFVPRIAKIVSSGFAPRIGSGRSTLAIVHAANVADGAVRAATSDAAAGRAFNLANDFDVTANDFFRFAAQGLGRRVRLVPLPRWLAYGVLTVGNKVAAMASNGRTSVTSGRSSLDFLTRDNPFSSDRAYRELGWSPRVRPEVGVPEAFAWWAANR